MKKTLNFIVILATLIIGTFLGVAIEGSSKTEEIEDHVENQSHGNMDHSHDVKEFVGAEVPTVKLEVEKDPVSGWNANIQETNFRFAPENASGVDIVGEGHAHIYVNGEKLNRVYGEWYHIKELPKGENEIKVQLSSNDHGELRYNGESISDSVTVSVD